DALLVIIELNNRGSRVLPAPTTSFTPTPFFDVNGDGFINPLDALLVIIKLNSMSSVGEPEPPEALLSAPSASSASEATAEADAPPTYLPPEFFHGRSASSSTPVGDDDDTDPLDAFFAEVGS